MPVSYSLLRLSFSDKKAGKFKEWLDISSLIDVKPSGAVMEILSFIAYETIGQVSVILSKLPMLIIDRIAK